MIAKLINFSLRNRFLVIVLVCLGIGVGLDAMRKLPIDAVPDVTNVQVQVLTNSPALGPVEVERFITFPVESAMSGLPDVQEIRSVSKFGLSAVTVVFEEQVDIYFARQLVLERLQQARETIPEGYGSPEMGPVSTGLGEIYQFEVRGDKRHSLMELRTILEWNIAPLLKSVPGVVEVNTFGGELKTYEVQLDPKRMVAYRIPISHIFEALERNNANTGGAYIIKNQEQLLIRGEGLVENLADLDDIVVSQSSEGAPVYLKQLGQAAFAPMVRQGAVTRDGRGEAVTGIVMMLIDENSRVVVDRVKQRMEEVKKTLPDGVRVETFYDRTDLIRRTIGTVQKNLLEGGILVIAVLLLLLGNLRGGLIVAAAIPLSMLVAFTGMVRAGISGNLMSLGAIDFGLIVDGSVVMIENIVRVLAQKRGAQGDRPVDPRQTIREAATEVARPIVFGVGIIMIVYLPILTLQGVEGKMFKPMAWTVVFALVGSLVLALTLMPVLASLFFKKGVVEKHTLLLRWAHRAYMPALRWAVDRPHRTATIAAAIFVLSLALVPFMGAEFIPRLDEGAIAMQSWRLPSVSLEESIRQTLAAEKVLKAAFPDEIETIVSKTGRAEIATDPMGVEISDVFVMLKPEKGWRRARSKEDLVEKMDEVLRARIPGTMFSYSQPIELRVSELIAGVRSDIAVKLYGDDLDMLKSNADEIVRIVSRVRGAEDVKAEQVAGLPVLRVHVKRREIARYGINAADVLDAVSVLGGRVVGAVLEGQRRFDLQVRFTAESRSDPEAIARIPVASPDGQQIPLGQLAEITIEEGPAQISRENIRRRISVELNVRGRDMVSFVKDAKAALDRELKLPAGYYLDWGGQFENYAAARERLMLAVPLALLLIFVLLYATFNSFRPAILIYLNVPLATTGGVLALFLRGMPFSISAGVGFIALFGVAVLNGLVLVSYIRKLEQEEGLSPLEAAIRGAEVRLRPVLMTALVAALGFVPMALATSAGAEVQRPLATVVIGGLVTSTLLTLLVVPSIYPWFAERRADMEQNATN